MRSELWRASWPVVVAFVVGAVLSQLAAPAYRQLVMSIAYEPYARLVFACDNSMRDHMLAKQRVAREPSAGNVALLKSADIGLLDCQDYDRMRKKLMQWGLRENELAAMGLKAIEERADTLQSVIRIHEIRY